tara:strand:- start:438 stop:941 length:504 start_codon:yes stop_codon:yes gene_type:complete
MGILVEIDISDLVWDEQTDGSYKYAVDRIDEFIDEISNKILPYDFKQVSDPVILIQLNNKLISHTHFNANNWDEDAISLSLFLVLDFESAPDIDSYFLTEHNNKSISCYFPDKDRIIFQSYSYGSHCGYSNGFFNPSKTKNQNDYIDYGGDKEMFKLYEEAKSILIK